MSKDTEEEQPGLENEDLEVEEPEQQSTETPVENEAAEERPSTPVQSKRDPTINPAQAQDTGFFSKLSSFWTSLVDSLNAPIARPSSEQGWLQTIKAAVSKLFGGGSAK